MTDPIDTPETDGARADRLARQVYALQLQSEVDVALIAHLESEGVLARTEIETLTTTLSAALATARRIGAAIGYIMALEGVSDAEAFDALKQASRKSNRPLREIAEEALAGE